MERTAPQLKSLPRVRVTPSGLFRLGLMLAAIIQAIWQPRATPLAPVWEAKPVLGYLLLTPSIVRDLEAEAVLTPAQLRLAQEIARLETAQVQRLREQSQVIVADPTLGLVEKRRVIQQMGYNQRVATINGASRETLASILKRDSLASLSAWVERRWEQERAAHGAASFSPRRAERSYKIFATRYDAGGKYAVALPDKCLKFANAGNHVCDSDGYQVNQGYMVILSYEGSTGAEVWESGPWNVDDNYWASLGDPQPRRMFADLPLGMPEAQAAYFDGYNGGADQFGRNVSAPFGIDLARQVSIDIGLEPGNNDWITVSYMWTDGWGKKPKGGQQQGATSAPVTPLPPAVQTSTPNPDGSVVHQVKEGQALWSIAAIYGVTLEELYQLNGLTKNSFIHPGDMIIVQAPLPTLTPTATLAPSATLPPTPTRAPATRTPPPASPSPEATATQTTEGEIGESPLRDPVLMVLIGAGVLGLGLLVVGMVFRRK